MKFLRETINALLKAILAVLPLAWLNRLFYSAVEILPPRTAQYLTLHWRPKAADGFHLKNFPAVQPNDAEKIAIVIQGPLRHDNAFTAETVKLYRVLFPEALVVVSTWEGEESGTLERIRSLGAEIVTNAKPTVSGLLNTNYQLRSSKAGLERAAALGARYALKTRSDQRCHAPGMLALFRNLQTCFPLGEGAGRQEARMIGISLNSVKYFPYFLTDHLLFGTINDMLVYWGATEDARDAAGIDLASMSGREWARAQIPEIHFCTEFLSKTGWKLAWTLADSWRAFSERFCIVDTESLDFYWPKYQPHCEYRFRDYSGRLTEFFSFADWLSLYAAKEECARSAPEHLLDVPVGKTFQVHGIDAQQKR